MPDFLSIQPYEPASIVASPSITPNFQDVLNSIRNTARPIGGEGNFQSALDTLKQPPGFDPGYQSLIDRIRSNANFYGNQASSAAQALASKRGISGSSTEQFGVQTALDNVNRTAADQEAQVNYQELQRRQALQDAVAKLYGDRATQEGTLGANLAVNEGNLTSDELASLRNMDFGQQQLALQKLLGQQGIDVANANIGASKDIARRTGQYGLIGSIGGAVLPSLIGNNGGKGWLSSLFGSSNPGATGAVAGTDGAAAPVLGNGFGIGANPLSLLGYGTTGATLPVAGAAPGMFSGLGTLLAAHPALAGALGGWASMGLDKFTTNHLTPVLGQTLGKTASTALNPLGAQLNFVKQLAQNPQQTISNVGKSVSSAVSKVFPF